jgi:hypothetical protein
MSHLTEAQLVLFHYGEAADPAAIEAHLEGCSRCAASHHDLQQLFAALDRLEVPQRSGQYGAEVWRRLRPQLVRRAELERDGWLRVRTWAWASAVAALVVAAFLAGRFWRSSEPTLAGPIAPQVRARILLVAVGDHLERSQMVLFELVNAKAGDPIDISSEQKWSEKLLPENRLYRLSAARAGAAGVASVLDELERTLLEIVHSPAQLSAAELERIRQRIEARGILFKIRVIGSHMQQKSPAPLAGLT